ncbi:hypothetical protein F383_24360 [Gossypium arboreum]|uniref:Uncharacterized protein n=1 Tax=Gossypium arboreum TaxID=29729 RepID=A0A0B0P5Y6_GOSAR|nr:hypothetical protein F383_21524 [Gossypium arboreum]KHG20465.1 hypothetical protein F383_24360 [Gossypium arboreum]
MLNNISANSSSLFFLTSSFKVLNSDRMSSQTFLFRHC